MLGLAVSLSLVITVAGEGEDLSGHSPHCKESSISDGDADHTAGTVLVGCLCSALRASLVPEIEGARLLVLLPFYY